MEKWRMEEGRVEEGREEEGRVEEGVSKRRGRGKRGVGRQQNGGKSDKLSHDINCTNYHVEAISDLTQNNSFSLCVQKL